jgi:flagellar protein FliL
LARQLDKARPAAADKGRGADTDAPPEPPKKRGRFKLILIVLVALIALGGGGGYYYMFMMKAKPQSGVAEKPAPALPHFVDVKPFVITVKGTDNNLHYVQLALSLKVPGEPAAKSTDAVMPEILDMIRQTVFGFKLDQLQSADGVNKLRAALVTGSNHVLRQSLGDTKVKELGGKDDRLVSNIYFSTLVIQ